MTEIPRETERLISDRLRELQDAHYSGDQASAHASLAALFDEYGREVVTEVRSRQLADRTAADLALFSQFGPAALIGDE